jgi:hypothetical protein
MACRVARLADHRETQRQEEVIMTTIPIPNAVRDNSETVIDYAFMGHRAPDKGVRTPAQRDRDIEWSDRHGYVHLQSYDVNPDGQRCRFDVLYNVHGVAVHFFHTEYYTRVPCATHGDYAAYYASITDQDGVTTVPNPYCDECVDLLRRSAEDSGMTLNLSEPLLIGQHD